MNRRQPIDTFDALCMIAENLDKIHLALWNLDMSFQTFNKKFEKLLPIIERVANGGGVVYGR